MKIPGSTSSTKAMYSLKLSRSNTKKKISFGKKGVRERGGNYHNTGADDQERSTPEKRCHYTWNNPPPHTHSPSPTSSPLALRREIVMLIIIYLSIH